MLKFILGMLLCLFSLCIRAQQVPDSVATQQTVDTTYNSQFIAGGYELSITYVRAYESNSRLLDVPAGIGYIDSRRLNRFNNTSIVSALNTLPGVRMEERSPGSYRLNVRGSSLRSPFGVRNVKVYYNDIPFTEPGGLTYLNSLGFYNFGSVEVIKGPGSSLYGTGTGGVMLIASPRTATNGATVAYTTGSNGLHNAMAEVHFANTDKAQHILRYQHMEYSGYRSHSAMQRQVISYDARLASDSNNMVEAHFLYSNLYYQTPGALTLTEYQQDNRAARPRVGALPGAAEANAAIYQKTFLGGISYRHRFSSSLENKSVVYGSFVRLLNPTIRNYERSLLPHFGGRTSFRYATTVGTTNMEIIIGGEGQQGYSSVRSYKTLAAVPDSLLTDDEINATQYFGFAQLMLSRSKWSFTVGASINQQQLSFTRFSQPPAQEYTRSFNNGIAPRFALLYRLSKTSSLYTSVSKGFSPPSTAELSPSGGALNTALNAENGWNYEIGGRGEALEGKLQWDASLFYLQLDNILAVRKDSANRDFYLNAGGTKQLGLEGYVSYRLLSKSQSPLAATVWASYTMFDFVYRSFFAYDADYTGKQLPGVAPHNLNAGLDAGFAKAWYANLTYFYSDRIALNDANLAYVDAYHLLGLRLGYKTTFGRRQHAIDIFAGADNLTDEVYSLGNDINAFGGRYYNAAPGRNYYIGLQLQYAYH